MSRGRKVGIGLLVLLVLLLGLVAIADRIGVGIAEDRIAEQAQTAIKNEGGTVEGKPDVSIGGFPFLTQVLAGNYDEITIKANKPQTNGVKLENMTLVATDVEAATSDLINGRGPVTAHKLTGNGFMTWETVKSLVQLSGLPVPIDLSADYSESSRQLAGVAPALWLVRHMAGPLSAFTLAAPVAYAASTVLARGL